jgi:hypothetical protein
VVGLGCVLVCWSEIVEPFRGVTKHKHTTPLHPYPHTHTRAHLEKGEQDPRLVVRCRVDEEERRAHGLQVFGGARGGVNLHPQRMLQRGLCWFVFGVGCVGLGGGGVARPCFCFLLFCCRRRQAQSPTYTYT